jgi:hypothetical protein
MKRIGLISDTHGYMDARILHHLTPCDEVWHAGDIGNLGVCDAIDKGKTLRAVHGNIDGTEVRTNYPENLHFEIEGLVVWLTHIAGPPGRYDPRIRTGLTANKPGLLVCGHSHICMVKRDMHYGHIHMNPGAAGRHGFHKLRTMLTFAVSMGKIEELRVVELGNRSAID